MCAVSSLITSPPARRLRSTGVVPGLEARVKGPVSLHRAERSLPREGLHFGPSLSVFYLAADPALIAVKAVFAVLTRPFTPEHLGPTLRAPWVRLSCHWDHSDGVVFVAAAVPGTQSAVAVFREKKKKKNPHSGRTSARRSGGGGAWEREER